MRKPPASQENVGPGAGEDDEEWVEEGFAEDGFADEAAGLEDGGGSFDDGDGVGVSIMTVPGVVPLGGTVVVMGPDMRDVPV